MLAACLRSIQAQSNVPGWMFEILIVENESIVQVDGIVARFSASGPHPVTYVHEPELGIPFARNAAVEAALERGADWIGFVDDDETLCADWLPNMIAAIDRYDSDAVAGPAQQFLNGRESEWVDDPKAHHPEGSRCGSASTCNVAFNSKLVSAPPEGEGLRFDTRFRFTGGSDRDFFDRATQAGARIVWSNDPVVVEHVPAQRLTLSWNLRRKYRTGWVAMQRAIRDKGRWRAGAQDGRVALGIVVLHIFKLVRAPYLGLRGRPQDKARLRKDLNALARNLGVLAGVTPFRPRPYLATDGH